GSDDHNIILWDISHGITSTPPLSQTLKGPGGSVNSVAFSPDGKLLASGSGDQTNGKIILWDISHGITSTPPLSQTLTAPGGSVNSLAFSPNSKTLASGNWDHNI